MLDEKVIRQKWNEIVKAHPQAGHVVDSCAFAVELVRWVESRPTPVQADVAPVRSCNDCGRDYESDGYCDHAPMCRNAA